MSPFDLPPEGGSYEPVFSAWRRKLLERVDHDPDEYVEAARVPLILEPANGRLDHVVELGKEVTRARIDAELPGDGVFDPQLRPRRKAVARINPDLTPGTEEGSILIVEADRVEADTRVDRYTSRDSAVYPGVADAAHQRADAKS